MIARRLGVPCVSELEISDHMWENIQDGDEIIVCKSFILSPSEKQQPFSREKSSFTLFVLFFE